MPAKKAAPKKQAATRKKPTTRRTKVRKTGDPLHDAWVTALESLRSAQDEAEKQIRAFLKQHKIAGKDAAGVLKSLRKRFEQERKKVTRELESELSSFQTRLKRERKAINKTVDDAVRSTLAAFNIPSRREVAELTRKVDQLSKKIDTLSPVRRSRKRT